MISRKAFPLSIIVSFCFVFISSSYSQNIDDDFLKGLALFQKENYVEALNSFNRFSGKDNYLLFFKKGLCYFYENQFNNAITNFLSADSLNHGYASINLAECYALIKEYKKSLYYLNIHMNSKFKLPESFIKLDKAFSELQNTKEWNEFWKNDWYTQEEILLRDAEYMISNGNYQDAIDLLDKFIKEHPAYDKAFILRAKAYKSIENSNKAISDYNKAIQINDKDPDLFVRRGELFLKLDKFSKSLEDINNAMILDPFDINLYYTRSILDTKLKNYKTAIDDLDHYLKYFTNDSNALFDCGSVYGLLNDTANSIKYFSKGIELYPNESKFYLSRAEEYMTAKDYQKAIHDYTFLMDIKPDNGFIFFRRGVARFDSGDKQGSCTDWQKAKSFGYFDADDYLVKYCQGSETGK